MCAPLIPIAAAVTAAAAVGGVAISAKNGAAQLKQQKTAAQQAMTQAAATKAANERAINQANAKSPDLGAIFANNLGINARGAGSTMLTGPGGAQIGAGLLGKSTLLGG